MTTSAIGGAPNQLIQSLVTMRSQFNDLQRQLSTGQKSDNYAGLGLSAGLSVNLNQQLSSINGFDASITTAKTQIDIASQALTSMGSVGDSVRSLVEQANTNSASFGTAQSNAQASLQQLLGMLNTQAGDRYVFSGLATDTPSVDTYDHILNGNGARAGLTQVISERSQADLGASGLGRLVVSNPTPTSVGVAEDAVSPFGFKLASVGSTLTNAVVTGPAGVPPSISVDMTGGQPNDGDTLSLALNLPDGSSENLTLTATTKSPPGPNQFTIGATTTDTATNLQAAMTTALGNLAGTSLKAASAVQASNEFFNGDSSNPPMRVNGPPFNTATSLVAGTAANTVIWYTGEAGATSARSTATARIDPALVVSYGTRANEVGIRSILQNVATLAAVQQPTGASATAFNSALGSRVVSGLSGAPGAQKITDIAADLAGAESSMQTMSTQHQQTSATLTGLLQQINGVSNEQVGAEILTLQTQMQASMQTTSMLLQTSLVHYLPLTGG